MSFKGITLNLPISIIMITQVNYAYIIYAICEQVCH